MAANSTSAASFHRLHDGPDILTLANAWDAGSAKLIESLGAKAIATSSAAVAWSHAYPDGDVLPVSLLLATVTAIARAVKIPITVDAEGGYAHDLASLISTISGLIDAGAVGINIEDGNDPPETFCAKIATARKAGLRLGVDLFINARSDVYLRNLKPEGERVTEMLDRAKQYREAGASGFFAPGAVVPSEIRELASGTALPLNILAWPGLVSAKELQTLGVRRLSAGSGISESMWGTTRERARAFLAEGRSDPLGEGAMDYGDLNSLMSS